jgi:hypothetical protein
MSHSNNHRVVPAQAGTHHHRLCDEDAGLATSKAPTGVMGPGLRRDDRK